MHKPLQTKLVVIVIKKVHGHPIPNISWLSPAFPLFQVLGVCFLLLATDIRPLGNMYFFDLIAQLQHEGRLRWTICVYVGLFTHFSSLLNCRSGAKALHFQGLCVRLASIVPYDLHVHQKYALFSVHRFCRLGSSCTASSLVRGKKGGLPFQALRESPLVIFAILRTSYIPSSLSLFLYH